MTSIEAESRPKDPNRPAPAGGLEVVAAGDFIFPRRQGTVSEFASLALEIIRNVHLNGASFPIDGAIRFSPKW
jgi:hypothetical protein